MGMTRDVHSCAASRDAGSWRLSNWNILMSAQTDAERELADLLVESLNLEGTNPGDIDPEAPLFNTGLGLDSIDALELGMSLQKRYGIKLSANSEETRKHFASVQALAALVASHQATA